MIPDTQVTPDTPTDHLSWIGEYLAEIQPDVIVHIGDHADMESLSSYDKGKKAAEGRRVIKDIEAANEAMILLTKPITDAYSPELHFTLGNHENRINIASENNASLEGFLTTDLLNYADQGWNVHDFLKPVEVDGVTYAHYFYNPMSGRPFGGESIVTKLKNIGFSFSMGHQQTHQTGLRELNNGRITRGLISGACYLHDESYKGHQGNGYWRGVIIKHEVFEGCYDIMEVSLDYLCRKYEGIPVSLFMQKKYPEIYNHSTWLKRLAERHLRAA